MLRQRRWSVDPAGHDGRVWHDAPHLIHADHRTTRYPVSRLRMKGLSGCSSLPRRVPASRRTSHLSRLSKIACMVVATYVAPGAPVMGDRYGHSGNDRRNS